MNEIERKFIATARQWADEKVPYEHRGTSRRGCDCTGLLFGIAKECGYLKDYSMRKYSQQWNLHKGASDYIMKEIEKWTDRIDNSRVGPGNIVVMQFGRCPSHTGIIVDNNRLMVHQFEKNCGYAILRRSKFSKRWIATYRINARKLKNA